MSKSLHIYERKTCIIKRMNLR
ncbi:protein of unknown function [Clostridium beijerinckii]|nr:protein of unknown function [Clostridium beijerinckii]